MVWSTGLGSERLMSVWLVPTGVTRPVLSMVTSVPRLPPVSPPHVWRRHAYTFWLSLPKVLCHRDWLLRAVAVGSHVVGGVGGVTIVVQA